MTQSVIDLVHCEVKLFKPDQVIEVTDAAKKQIVAQHIDDQWQFDELLDYRPGLKLSSPHPVMVITLTPMPNDCPITPYKSYIELEIREAGDVMEFFGYFCDNIIGIAARKLNEDVDLRSTWFTFTLVCHGAYWVHRDNYGGKHGSFELGSVNELDYSKLELAIRDEAAEVEMPEELRAKGFYMQTPSGHNAHVLGDPDMSEEEMDALSALIDAAYKAVGGDEIKPDGDQNQDGAE